MLKSVKYSIWIVTSMIVALTPLVSAEGKGPVARRSSPQAPVISRPPDILPTQDRPFVIIRNLPDGGKFFKVVFAEDDCQEQDHSLYPIRVTGNSFRNNDEILNASYCKGVRQSYSGRIPLQEFKSLIANRNLDVEYSDKEIYSFTEAATYNVNSWDEEAALLNRWQRSTYPRVTAAAATPRSPAPRPLAVSQRGGPSALDITRAMQAIDARHTGWRITAKVDEMAYPSPGGGIGAYEYRHVYGVSCAPAGRSQYHCTYTRTLSYYAAPGSLWGRIFARTLNQQVVNPKTSTNTFIRYGNEWASPTYERTIIAYEEQKRRQMSQPQYGSSSGSSSSVEPSGVIPDIDGTMCDLGSKSYCR